MTDPADRLQMGRNGAAIGVAAAAIVAIISLAVAIWHPAIFVRAAAALLACLSVIAVVYRTYRYRASLDGQVILELSAQREPPVSRRTALFLASAILGVFLLAMGGKLHGAAGAWFVPGSNDLLAVLFALVGVAVMIGTVVGIIVSNIPRRTRG